KEKRTRNPFCRMADSDSAAPHGRDGPPRPGAGGRRCLSGAYRALHWRDRIGHFHGAGRRSAEWVPGPAQEAKMSTPWKPNGHSSIAPYLLVDDARALIRFLTEVFDAAPGRTFDRPDGTIAHAEVDIDGSTVMISDATKDWAAFPSMIH